MKILNFGSLNVDRVFQVAHFVRPGETLGSSGYAVHAGGKGANQSAALALAGASVWHAGRVGADGEWLLRLLAGKGVDVSLVVVGEEPTGQAVIQVDAHGENAIILDGGANHAIASGQIAATLGHFGPGDVVLLQNEISRLGEIIAAAAAQGLKVWLNPAPFDEGVLRLPLDKVSTVVVNETEGRGLAGLAEGDPEAVLAALRQRYPSLDVVLTLGARGAWLAPAHGERVFVPARKVAAVDTTAAGDTFIGFLLAGIARGLAPETAMGQAAAASAICVGREGALNAIPTLAEVEQLLAKKP